MCRCFSKRRTLFTAAIVFSFLFTGCKTVKETIEVPVYIHDTTAVVKEVHDSTYIDKWHTIYINGDTVRVKDSVVLFRCRVKTDTAYIYSEKPVIVTQAETVEVERPLRWWQKMFMYIGLVGLIGLIGWIVLKIYRK